MNTETEITGIFSSLAAGGYSVRFRGFNAIDQYIGLPALPYIWAETNADIAVLARFIDNLRFPGLEIADGAADIPDGTCYFQCLEFDEKGSYSFHPLSFAYNLQTRHFEDPLGVYRLLRELKDKRKHFLNDGILPSRETSLGKNYRAIMDAALLLSRYGFGVFEPSAFKPKLTSSAFPKEDITNNTGGPLPGPEAQRAFLSCLLVSPRPDLGLELLKRSGFLKELWPELACFDDVDHSKEFHPEGNVWNHTLETFRYRKATAGGSYDLRLSLALLLHDAGKPIAASHGSRRFDGHAELGASAAARFLERLEFTPDLVEDIYYLVRNHMLPAALKRLPLTKTKAIMGSPLFPTLMELYRCDESSSFKGLDDYYENSAAYQTYLKNVRNPYRSADGKKMGGRMSRKGGVW